MRERFEEFMEEINVHITHEMIVKRMEICSITNLKGLIRALNSYINIE